MLNHIVLIGRLTDSVDMRYTSNGTPVANFTLAVERNYKNSEGETEVDYIKVVCWRKLAENVAHHLGKGRLVAVDGSLQIKKSKKDNRTYINPEVIAKNVQFLDWPDKDKGKLNDNYVDENAEVDDGLEEDDFQIPF